MADHAKRRAPQHLIDERGIALLRRVMPTSWVLREYRPDYGLDYAVEVEWFDQQLGKMLAQLESAGELENTIIIVTSDHGQPFPRVKGQVYEDGIHIPLAIRWAGAARSLSPFWRC